jgi:asparagine synthase (glutamine-hydrolysing)
MDAAESQAPEWANAEQVAAASGAHHHYSDFTGDDLLHILENHNLMDHDSVDLWYEFGVRKQARNRGVKTMLSGWGGDQFITAYGNERYAETFWRGQIISSTIDLYRATAGSPRRIRRFIPMFFREVLLPVLPPWMPFKRSEADFYSYDYLACATEEFETYTRKLQKWPSPSPGITVKGQQLDEYEVNHLVNRLESWAVSGKQVGIEYRYPLLDRRLVEFALGIPADLYRRRGIPRYLFRRTVRGLLPRAIWEDTLKEEPIRVQRLLLASREALIRWREKYAHCDTPNRFIDRQRLYQLIDEIDGWGPELSIPQIFKILSAIKSILVLNMSIEKEHPDAGAWARHDGNTTSVRSSWDDPAKWKGARGEQILPDDKPVADFDTSEWQW